MKTTVVLFYFNEMSIKEIAKITGSFEGTDKNKTFCCKKKVEKVFRNRYGGLIL